MMFVLFLNKEDDLFCSLYSMLKIHHKTWSLTYSFLVIVLTWTHFPIKWFSAKMHLAVDLHNQNIVGLETSLGYRDTSKTTVRITSLESFLI